jgi:hypothetical protein
MRPREVWFWLGAAFITVGAVLTTLATAYYIKEPSYSLGTGPQMLMAYGFFVGAFLCFLAAIAGWRPWLKWQRFPNLVVRVDSDGFMTAERQLPGFPVMPIKLRAYRIHITNSETDRSASIRAAYLLVKPQPNFPVAILLTAPRWQVTYPEPLNFLRVPVNLDPQASEGGDLIFELDFQMEHAAEPFEARFEIHDSISRKMASFPAVIGEYRRRHGLRPTTYAERIPGSNATPPWYGVMGPPDPE